VPAAKEDAMADTKVDVKLPDGSAFSAEGPEALVTQLFQQFIEASRSATSARGIERTPDPPPVDTEVQSPVDDGGASGAVNNGAGSGQEVDQALMDRVFVVDRDGVVSLRVMPAEEADALILLLYGAQRLRGEHALTATQLMKAARQSGIQADRLDRILSQRNALITMAGIKKGKRYGLNNPGVREAARLLSVILG
jgi:hypothetical protein